MDKDELYNKLLLLKLENKYTFDNLNHVLLFSKLSSDNIIEIIKFNNSILKYMLDKLVLDYKCKEYMLENNLYIEDLIFYQHIEEKLYFKYQDKINKYAEYLVTYRKITLPMILCIIDYIKNNKPNILRNILADLVCNQKLNEKIIYEYRDYFNWRNICRYQDLSEEFIEENISYIDWNTICYQHLSYDFIKKYLYDFPNDTLGKMIFWCKDKKTLKLLRSVYR